MNTGFSSRMKEVFTYVREEVIRLGHKNIGPEHLFLGILREGNGSAIKVLKKIGVNLKDLKLIIENNIPQRKKLTDCLVIIRYMTNTIRVSVKIHVSTIAAASASK